MSMDEQYADWEIDLHIEGMIEAGVLDPEDDVLIQEIREQIAEQLAHGGARGRPLERQAV